ncbi:hypothetical protein WJX75_004763 [Coccomyxa subellipsoidea]|uniref:Uncharacterized protein n=1 Tax=Coccomyxa subellipsoidea TaxID=248742 RepID=A0ABR2YI27_9CHLO
MNISRRGSFINLCLRTGRDGGVDDTPVAKGATVMFTKLVTEAFFKNFNKAPKKLARETVVPEPSYNIPLVLAGLTGLSAFEGNLALAGLTGILGAFLAIQASRVKFIFRDDELEVALGETEKETENAFVGGANVWKYDTFTNWEFWWPGFPVLVYFKETQTKPEGQIHFFPIIFNSKQLYSLMVERCGASQNSGPEQQ